ncbi:TPA: hypothetical protein HA241_07445 [Candidatus Woesearchaeota archaeon]|nr:hypothetical protein [Candidatus Woesearchaeota archaeon]
MKKIILVCLVLLFVVSCSSPELTDQSAPAESLGIGDTTVEELEDLQIDLEEDVSFEEVNDLTILD